MEMLSQIQQMDDRPVVLDLSYIGKEGKSVCDKVCVCYTSSTLLHSLYPSTCPKYITVCNCKLFGSLLCYPFIQHTSLHLALAFITQNKFLTYCIPDCLVLPLYAHVYYCVRIRAPTLPSISLATKPMRERPFAIERLKAF